MSAGNSSGSAGSVNLTSTAGAITVNGAINSAGTIVITGGGNLTSGGLTVNGLINSVVNIAITDGGNITFGGPITAQLVGAQSCPCPGITVFASGGINGSGSVTSITSNGGSISFQAINDIVLGPANINSTVPIGSAAGGNISFGSFAGSVNLGTSSLTSGTTTVMAPVFNGQTGAYQGTITVAAVNSVTVGNLTGPGPFIQAVGSTSANAVAYVLVTTVPPGVTNPSTIGTGTTQTGTISISQDGEIIVGGNGVTMGTIFGNGSAITVNGGSGALVVGTIYNDIAQFGVNLPNRLSWYPQVTMAGKTIAVNSIFSNSGGISLTAGDGITINGGTIEANCSYYVSQSSVALSAGSGNIQLNSGTTITANAGALSTDNSGSIYLSTTNSIVTSGNVSLNANATGNNLAGGSITIVTSAFTGSTLALTANGYGTGGGGSIQIDFPPGAVQLNSSNVSVSAVPGVSGGNGGSIRLASEGNLTVDPGLWNLNGTGASGNGGFVELSTGDTPASVGGTLTLTGSGTITANGSGSGNGGTIIIYTPGYTSDVLIGTSPGISLSATGYNGGQMTISAGRNIEINSATINVLPTGDNGNGGQLKFYAGITTTGNLTLQGNLSVNGNGSGTGGTIILDPIVHVNPPPAPGPPATIQINGNLSADGGATGNGGTIQILANGTSGSQPTGAVTLNVGSTSQTYSITARSGTSSGNGGQITILSNGAASLYTSLISADAQSAGDGGWISIAAGAVDSSSPLTVQGTISAKGAGIVIDSGTERGGNGGHIAIISGNNLTADNTTISVATLSSSGNGGTLTMQAGMGGASSLLEISSQLSADASGTGQAGTIMLTGGSVSLGQGRISASAVNGGTAGSIQITSTSASGLVDIGTSGVTVTIVSQGSTPFPALV